MYKVIAREIIFTFLVLGILAVCILTGFVIYANRSTISTIFFNATTVQPEPFTELYFENNERLPQKEAVIQNYDAVKYSFSFTIHNVENKDVTYIYEVHEIDTHNKLIGQGTVQVKKDQRKTIQQNFYLPNRVVLPTEIIVTLVNKEQSISFWMGGNK